MDNLDLAFLALFRTRRDFARRAMRYGVVRFRRQLRQSVRITDYPMSGADRFREPFHIEAMMDEVQALAAARPRAEFSGLARRRVLGCRER